MKNSIIKLTTVLSEENTERLKELVISSLETLYWTEKYLVKVLPRFIKATSSGGLKSVFEAQLAKAEVHVVKIERAFKLYGEKSNTTVNLTITELIKIANQLLESTTEGSIARDYALLMAFQKVQHYKIASYSSLRRITCISAYFAVGELFQTILDEEIAIDKQLAQLAESVVNQQIAVG